MRKVLVILFLILMLTISFAGVATLVEVRVNSFRIPSMSMYREGIDGQCKIYNTTYLQLHTSPNVPISRSASPFRDSDGYGSGFEKDYVANLAFLREAGVSYSLKVAVHYSTSTNLYGGFWNQNCAGGSSTPGTIGVRCKIKGGDNTFYNPCSGSATYSANLIVESNCKYMQSSDPTNLRDGFCFNLGSV